MVPKKATNAELKQIILAVHYEPFCCYKCKVNGTVVRLYRPGGEFYRPTTVFCNQHVPLDGRQFYIPCVMNRKNGAPWGFTSVPDEDCEIFYATPEKNPKGWSWRREGGWKDKSAPPTAPMLCSVYGERPYHEANEMDEARR